MRKMINGIAAVLAVSALMAGSALATDKLIVNNAGGTAVFKVDDAGTFQVPGSFIWDNTGKKIGIGLTTPTAAFHLNYKTPSTPFILEREFDTSGAVSMVGDNYGGTGAGSGTGAGMLFRYYKGNKAAPSSVAVGDRLGFLVFGGYAGSAMQHTAAINALVDSGTVSGTSLPTYLQFLTTADGSVSRTERMRIAADGRIRLSNQPAAPANNAPCTVGDMILDAPNGFLYLCSAPNSWKRTAFTSY